MISEIKSRVISQEEFSTYAAPILMQMAGMARRAKKDFAAYLIEMAASDLLANQDTDQRTPSMKP